MTVRIKTNKKTVNSIVVFEARGIRRLSEYELAAVNGGAGYRFILPDSKEVSDSQRCYNCYRFCELSCVTCPYCGRKL